MSTAGGSGYCALRTTIYYVSPLCQARAQYLGFRPCYQPREVRLASWIFPCLVALLEAAAGVVYFYHGQYWLALAWGCYAIAAVALGIAGHR